MVAGRNGVTRATGLGLGLVLAGCGGVDTGVVEMSWVFVDRDGEPIFPAGQFVVGNRDSCSLPGRIGDERVDYRLEVELEICDPTCQQGCDNAACQVIDPLAFSCETARGSDPDVPSSNDPYQFSLHAVIRSSGLAEPCRDPADTCVAIPGPRERIVEPGLVTDLQVYQIVVDVDQSAPTSGEGSLDLDACCTQPEGP